MGPVSEQRVCWLGACCTLGWQPISDRLPASLPPGEPRALLALSLPTQARCQFGSSRGSCRRRSRCSRGAAGRGPGSYVRALLRGRWPCAAPTPAPCQTVCHASGISFASAALSSLLLLSISLAAHRCGLLGQCSPPPPPPVSSFPVLFLRLLPHSAGPASALALLQAQPANQSSGLFPRNQPMTCTLKSPHFCSFVAAPAHPGLPPSRAFTVVVLGCWDWFSEAETTLMVSCVVGVG